MQELMLSSLTEIKFINMTLKVFIGWDSREDIAYQIAKHSLQRYASIPLTVRPIRLFEIRERQIFWRAPDPLATTEFSFSRFLTPYLAGYDGWALFCDSDFLFRKDIAELADYMDPKYAVSVVKHDYKPTETMKKDGVVQTQYERKNWSSFMLFNCGHEQVKNLLPKVVNTESGLYLHRFQWLTDDVIGELPITFNYLEGWHTKADEPDPIAVHFTRGGPWLKGCLDREYGHEWMEQAGIYYERQ